MTGVGFLGAGVIMRLKGRLSGITTAASIWAAAALGLGLGVGMYAISLTAGHPKVDELELTFEAHDLQVHSRRQAKQNGQLVVRLTAMGSDRAHRSVMGGAVRGRRDPRLRHVAAARGLATTYAFPYSPVDGHEAGSEDTVA